MKSFKLKTVLFSALAVTWLFGCKDDPEPPEQEVSPPVVNVSGIPSNGFGFLYFEETHKAFTVESDSPWEISKTDGWFTVSPYKGDAGTTNVSVYVVNNDDIARNGTFTITANSGTHLKPVETSQSFSVSQSAYRSAGISIDGLTTDEVVFNADNPGTLTFNMLAAFAWDITLSNEAWLTVSPKNGSGGQSVTITVTPVANTVSDTRECMLTITCTDPDNPGNAGTKEIFFRQRPYYDWDTQLAIGAVLFNDDFDWIAPLWPATSSKYGFPTVTLGTPEVSGSNEPGFTTASFSAQVTAKGWTATSAYARYEGWVKLGTASLLGSLTTPALTSISAGKVVNLLVSFDGAVYASAGGTIDTRTFIVEVLGDGTINDTEEQSIVFTMQTYFGFDRYYCIVNGATASTKIRFAGYSTATSISNTRFIVDNIKIARAENFDPVLPPTEAMVLPINFEVSDLSNASVYDAGDVVGTGATLRYLIRVNRAWTAAPSANWLRFTYVQGGGNGTPVNSGNGGSVASGVGAATATGIAYNHCFIDVDPNPTTSPRTAIITVASGGQTVETITITQKGSDAADNITLIGITDDKVTLVAESPSILLFKVNATTDWTISATDTWYTVLPVVGVPNKDVEVVLVPQTNNGAARSGSFTITAGASTKTITVEQAGVASGEVVLASWMLPYKGTVTNATYFSNYVALDGTADAREGQWWVKSDDGNSIIRGSRAGVASQLHMSYSTYLAGDTNQDRIIMYGFTDGDYWQMEIPTTGIAAGSNVKIEGYMQGSSGGSRDYLFQYSTDMNTWTNINPKTTGAIIYTVQLPNAITEPISETFTIGSAIPAGTFYIRLLVNSTIRTNGSSPQTDSGTSWITRPTFTGDADKLPIMKVSKL